MKKTLYERGERRRRAENGPEPICGCRHHLAYHDAREGVCYAEVRDSDHAEERSQCSCRRYSGPEPLATLYAPELSGSVRQDRPTLEP
ncbi:hypothetical protein [Streptomyces sp. NPDC056796]|uniref:hypothetical protein n=1 Tax=Streptomyces sp. NPDC056796 TaxID=3345947 RepID=UPI0036791B91